MIRWMRNRDPQNVGKLLVLVPMILFAIGLAAPASAQSPIPDSLRVARLAALGQVWGVAKYFHPMFLSRIVNWDSAVVAAIPRVRAARTTAEYGSAVNDMLGALGDARTRVVSASASFVVGAPVVTRWTSDSTLIVTISSFAGTTINQQLGDVAALVRLARQIIFDIRSSGISNSSSAAASDAFDAAGLDALLATQSLVFPTQRRRVHVNIDLPQAVNAYAAAAYHVPGMPMRAVASNPERRVVFIIDELAEVPTIAWALQRAGQARVVMAVSDGATMTSRVGSPGTLFHVPLGEGLEATIAVAELLVAPDTLVARVGSYDAPMGTALEHVRSGALIRRLSLENQTRFSFVPPDESRYVEMTYPTLPYRILAAYQWWNAIQYLYPHKHLIGEDWNAALHRGVHDAEVAQDSKEYVMAVMGFAARIHDSHANVTGGPAGRGTFFGYPPRVLVQYIEGVPVVIYVSDDSVTKASGITLGDVILTIDGESTAALKTRMTPYLSASTPQALDDRLAFNLLRGPDGTSPRLTVRGGDNRIRTITKLSRAQGSGAATEAAYLLRARGPILRMLPGNIGYADLARLTVSMVDSMFDMFHDTKAIIFDNRGYPQRTAWAIAPRLADRQNISFGQIHSLAVLSPNPVETYRSTETATVPTASKRRYQGKTVLLIDERAFSESEHTGQMLKAANSTTFVGSATAGANGNVARVFMPGGVSAGFTRVDIRLADGGQLQRVGLTPDIRVKPTIAGVRAGRDELLERALVFLRK